MLSFIFYFKESNLVTNAFINSKQHPRRRPLTKSTNTEQEHLNVGDTEGIKWQLKMYLYIFLGFALLTPEWMFLDNVVLWFQLLFVAIVQHNLSVYQ